MTALLAPPIPWQTPGLKPRAEVPRVVVVMPKGSSYVLDLAGEAFLLAVNNRTAAPEDRVEFAWKADARTSANNMQELWAVAKNLRDDGLADHMAMIHSDVAAPPGWVNTLWREMRTHRLSLVSACISIKDDTGRTSTAVGSMADPWRGAKRYVRRSDAARLPTTFTVKDVAESPDDVLLVNNGLMLLDLRVGWLDDFDFVCHSRVRRNEEGVWRHQFRSEDWELSRLFHAVGVPYGATFAVAADHHGETKWPNRAAAAVPDPVDVPC